MNGGDPEVGGARVKQHSEVLWWGSDADLPIVLGLRREKKLCCDMSTWIRQKDSAPHDKLDKCRFAIKLIPRVQKPCVPQFIINLISPSLFLNAQIMYLWNYVRAQ